MTVWYRLKPRTPQPRFQPRLHGRQPQPRTPSQAKAGDGDVEEGRPAEEDELGAGHRRRQVAEGGRGGADTVNATSLGSEMCILLTSFAYVRFAPPRGHSRRTPCL